MRRPVEKSTRRKTAAQNQPRLEIALLVKTDTTKIAQEDCGYYTYATYTEYPASPCNDAGG